MDIELSTKLGALLSEAQMGNSESYSEFLGLIYDLVEKSVYRKLNLNKEDVVQEVILSIHNARHSYNPSREFYPWFYAIVNARIVDEKRRNFREDRKVTAYGVEIESRTGENLLEGDFTEDLNTLMQSLPEKQKKIIELNKLHGFSMKEIADQMGMSVENVKVIAHRGLNNLKSVVKDRNDG